MKSIEINSKSVRQRPRLSRAALLNEINRNQTHTHTHTQLGVCTPLSLYVCTHLYIQIQDSSCIYKFRIHFVYTNSGLILYIKVQDSICIYTLRTHIVYTSSGLNLYIQTQDSAWIYSFRTHILYTSSRLYLYKTVSGPILYIQTQDSTCYINWPHRNSIEWYIGVNDVPIEYIQYNNTCIYIHVYNTSVVSQRLFFPPLSIFNCRKSFHVLQTCLLNQSTSRSAIHISSKTFENTSPPR